MLATTCADRIEEGILNGEFKPGQKLKVEELKTLIGTGATPIREALSRLSVQGLVIAKDQRGFQVAPVSEDDIKETFDAMFQIEALLLKLSIERGGEEWEEGVVATLHRLSKIELRKEKVSYLEFRPANSAFHASLGAGCGSKTLIALRDQLNRKFDRYIRLAFSHEVLQLNHKEHKELAKLAIGRDVVGAISCLKDHMLGGVATVVARVMG